MTLNLPDNNNKLTQNGIINNSKLTLNTLLAVQKKCQHVDTRDRWQSYNNSKVTQAGTATTKWHNERTCLKQIMCCERTRTVPTAVPSVKRHKGTGYVCERYLYIPQLRQAQTDLWRERTSPHRVSPLSKKTRRCGDVYERHINKQRVDRPAPWANAHRADCPSPL